MPGAWCLVPGAWCLVPGAWCLVGGAWCLVGVLQRHFGELGGLAGTGVAADDDDGILPQRLQNVGAIGADGQFRRVVEFEVLHHGKLYHIFTLAFRGRSFV